MPGSGGGPSEVIPGVFPQERTRRNPPDGPLPGRAARRPGPTGAGDRRLRAGGTYSAVEVRCRLTVRHPGRLGSPARPGTSPRAGGVRSRAPRRPPTRRRGPGSRAAGPAPRRARAVPPPRGRPSRPRQSPRRCPAAARDARGGTGQRDSPRNPRDMTRLVACRRGQARQRPNRCFDGQLRSRSWR